MSFLEILLVALALSVDAFTVGAVVGLSHHQPRQFFRLSFHFGLFQALMPLLGAVTGSFLEKWIHAWNQWISFGLLSFIGSRMIICAFKNESKKIACDPTRGLTLIGLSTAVSIDALAVGFTLGLQNVSIPFVVTVIGIAAALLTFTGMLLSRSLFPKLGKKAEIVAGVVLIGLGFKMLLF